MQQNHPKESMSGQAHILPQERMEDLPPRVLPPQSPLNSDDTTEINSAELQQREAETFRFTIGKLNDFLRWFLAVIEIMLAIRFLLKLISASPDNMFASFLYTLTEIIILPFKTIVPSPTYFEWPTLIAMGIYWLVFWAITRFLRIVITSPEEPAS